MTERRQILLVEDESAHVELIRRAFDFEPNAFELLVEQTLAKARDRLGKVLPDLVIADFLLPDGRGTELLHKEEGDLTFPVLILTSHGSEEIAVEAMKAGAVDYVVKTEHTLIEMPQIARRVLREWSHIVDRRKAEERAARFATILEETVSEVYICDVENLRLLLANRRARENLGYGQDEITGVLATEFLPGFDEPSLRRELNPLRSGQSRTVFIRTEHRRRDGSRYPIEAHMQSLVLEGVEVFVSFVLDVSDRIEAERERRELEKQLERSRRLEAIGTLAGGIAHDFKNLLSPIMSYGELALRDLEAGSRSRRAVERQLTAARRAFELVEQILVFARQTEPEREAIAIGPIIEEALDLVEATLPENVELNRRIDPECGIVQANAAELHQVVMNLCSNGIHAMRKGGGCLDVALAAVATPGNRGTEALLEVHDEGHGIDEATLEKIFDPFFTTKGMMEGSGLGLSVVYGIVNSWEGEIEVDSTPGSGSRFSVSLPLVSEGQ